MVKVPLKVTSTKKKGDYEIRSYSVTKLQNLEDGPTLTKLLQLLDYVGAHTLERGEAVGLFNGTTKFRVAFKDDKPVAVHMKGESEGDEGAFNKKFGKKGVFGREGGSGLYVQGGRTKRNRRGRKGGKTRKLTTRCR
jgi:hypothetical protein